MKYPSNELPTSAARAASDLNDNGRHFWVSAVNPLSLLLPFERLLKRHFLPLTLRLDRRLDRQWEMALRRVTKHVGRAR